MSTALPKSRYTVEETASGVRFDIPGPKRWYSVIVLGCWLVIWGGAGLQATFGWFGRSSELSLILFHITWTLTWLLSIIGGALVMLWLVVGREVIDVSAHRIAVRRQVLGLGRTLEYDGEYIRQLRVAPVNYAQRTRYLSFEISELAGGKIAFDYGAKTVRFGAGLDEAEARMLVETIVQRFHNYQRK